MWPNPQETEDLVTLTEKILHEKHYLCSVNITNFKWFHRKILKQAYAETGTVQITEAVVRGCSSKWVFLTLSWWRPLLYRNQSIDLLYKSMDWFLYNNGLRHERVKSCANFTKTPVLPSLFSKVTGLKTWRCFLVKLAKSLRTLFFTVQLRWLLLRL